MKRTKREQAAYRDGHIAGLLDARAIVRGLARSCRRFDGKPSEYENAYYIARDYIADRIDQRRDRIRREKARKTK